MRSEHKQNFSRCFELKSPVMDVVYRELERYAMHGRNCIMFGPTGAGKEYAAKHFHAVFRKTHHPSASFRPINCSCLSKDLAMSELFGHLKGSFTHAQWTRKGAFEITKNGVLFLDEVGDLQEEVQAYLLRALDPENGTARALGGTDDYSTRDVTVICSTEKSPETIRPALLARLGKQVFIPGVNERPEDIPPAVKYFVRRALSQCADVTCIVEEYTKQTLSDSESELIDDPFLIRLADLIAEDLVSLVTQRSWPSNFRAMGNAIDTAIVCAHRKGTLNGFIDEVVKEFRFHSDRYSGGPCLTVMPRDNATASESDEKEDVVESYPELFKEITNTLKRARQHRKVVECLTRFLVSTAAKPFERADLDGLFPDMAARTIQKYLSQCTEAGVLRRSGQKGQIYCYVGQNLTTRAVSKTPPAGLFARQHYENAARDERTPGKPVELTANSDGVLINNVDPAPAGLAFETSGVGSS